MKYFELKGIKNTAHNNLWKAAKAVLRGTFISFNTYFSGKKEWSKINYLYIHMKKSEE